MVGRSQNVPLYQEPLPPEAINPKRRAITTAELRGNPFHASRRDMIQRVNADRFRENVCSWDPAGTYGCKNSKQPGADYESPDGNIGWQSGLQMVQRPTNKDPSRLRVFQREMTYRTTFAEDAPRKTTHIGIPLETMRGGDIRLPKNMHVSNYFRPPVPTTGPGGVRQEAPFYPRSAQYTQTGRSALSNYAGGSFAKEFVPNATRIAATLAPPPSAEAGDTSYSSAGAYFRASDPAPTPELQQLRECIESKPDAVYLGANIESRRGRGRGRLPVGTRCGQRVGHADGGCVPARWCPMMSDTLACRMLMCVQDPHCDLQPAPATFATDARARFSALPLQPQATFPPAIRRASQPSTAIKHKAASRRAMFSTMTWISVSDRHV